MAPFPPSCSAVLPMSAQDYFAERDSAPFRTLMAAVLDLGEVKWVAQWAEGEKKFHKLVTSPDYEKWVPKPGRKFIKKEDLDFFDTIEYNPELLKKPPYKLPVTSELALLGDKLVATRMIVIEEIDATHCRHSVTGEVKVKIFGIGKLAENSVVDSTVKTFAALPMVVERYMEVRTKLLQSPQGRAALMEGRPDDLDAIDKQILGPLQKPFAKMDSAEIVDVESVADDDEEEDLGADDSEDTSTGSTARALQRQETQYFDADEELEDVEYSPESTQEEGAVCTTNAAIKRDRNRVRAAIDRMHERHAHRPISKLGRKARRESRMESSPEEEEQVAKKNAASAVWQEYWRQQKVAVAPIPNYCGRVVNLFTLGQAKGLLSIVTLGAVSEKGINSDSKQDATDSTSGSSPSTPQSLLQKGPIHQLLGKMKLGKH